MQVMSSVAAAGTTAIAIRSNRTDGVYVDFLYGTTGVGPIQYNGTSTQYLMTSDYRLKDILGQPARVRRCAGP